MSDDSSDEFFASADEEFDNDPDLMLSSHKVILHLFWLISIWIFKLLPFVSLKSAC